MKFFWGVVGIVALTISFTERKILALIIGAIFLVVDLVTVDADSYRELFVLRVKGSFQKFLFWALILFAVGVLLGEMVYRPSRNPEYYSAIIFIFTLVPLWCFFRARWLRVR